MGCLVFRGCEKGLKISPQLPSQWETASITRRFRGATFEINFQRGDRTENTLIRVDGAAVEGDTIAGVEAGKVYDVTVTLPAVL